MKTDGKELYSKKKYLLIKGILDYLFSLLMLPFLLVLLLAVKIVYLFHKDYDKIIFRQIRVGKDERLFKILKIRTMKAGAEEELDLLLNDPSNYQEWTQFQKLKNDPRITKFGYFLRKSSLDEFPQFINVLKGDMSIIGPRPLVPGELEAHKGNKKYFRLKPGITGLWASRNRSIISYDDRLKIEYKYIDTVSLKTDLKIFFYTILSILKKEGI